MQVVILTHVKCQVKYFCLLFMFETLILWIRKNRSVFSLPFLCTALKSSAQFHEQQKKLERAKTGDVLKHKIQQRPDREELVRKHILEGKHLLGFLFFFDGVGLISLIYIISIWKIPRFEKQKSNSFLASEWYQIEKN